MDIYSDRFLKKFYAVICTILSIYILLGFFDAFLSALTHIFEISFFHRLFSVLFLWLVFPAGKITSFVLDRFNFYLWRDLTEGDDETLNECVKIQVGFDLFKGVVLPLFLMVWGLLCFVLYHVLLWVMPA